MFDIQFENDKEEKQFAWQNSWGLTTRSIGVMIMVHSDDKGLVLPPKVAPTQVVIVPIILSSQQENEKKEQIAKAESIMQNLKALGYRVHLDDRLGYSPGWKYNHWELKGVPVRIEIGPKDMKNQTVAIARRDTGAKVTIPWADAEKTTQELLESIHKTLFEKARTVRDSHLLAVDKWDDFLVALDKKKIPITPWCGGIKCEETVKDKSKEAKASDSTQAPTGAKTLCLPFNSEPIAPETKCFACGADATTRAMWGRTY